MTSSPKVYVMRYRELKEWVETKAQIGDVAYCYDPVLKHSYIYCYRGPDDNPFWIKIQPESIENFISKNSKAENESEIQEYHNFLESLADFLIWDTGKRAREARYKIEAFLKRMNQKHD